MLKQSLQLYFLHLPQPNGIRFKAQLANTDAVGGHS